MSTRHRATYSAIFALALVALGCYVTTVVMVVLELTHPALAAVQGACFICMSPWVGVEFLVGLVAVLLVIIAALTCLGTGLARRDFAWSLAFGAPMAVAFGFAVLVVSGAGDAIVARLGASWRTIALLAVCACLLLIPLLALRYTHHLRLAWSARDT